MTDRSQERSLRDRLNKIAKDTDTPTQAILTDFLIERTVYRLTKDEVLWRHLIFKGGYVGLRCYQSPRYTVDLDAIVHNKSKDEILSRAKIAMSIPSNDYAWFEFEEELDLTTQNEYGGTRLQYRAGIGEKLLNIRRAQIIKIDIGIGDPVTPAPIEKTMQEKLGKGSISWQVYPVETIIAEKIHCLISRGSENSRSKDIFDLAFYLPQCDKEILKKALQNTFSYRGDSLPSNLAESIKGIDSVILERGWRSATALLPTRASFQDSFDQIIKWFESNMI